ncbi:Peptidase S26 [Dillenia turbinata]|uniref:Peptidase S26 n=1 Tax=Dillenia turbinata TaxID=194707 RepID=A0AAN8ZPS4_9MAGN
MWKNIAKEAWRQTLLVAKFLSILHISSTYVCSSILVYGPSMLPTLNMSGDVLLVEHLSKRFGKLVPGDIVVVRSPLNPNKSVTKRILAVEGDPVTFLVEPRQHHQHGYHSLVVPKGHVWIQGDNMYASADSRHFGPVPYGLIKGRAFCRVCFLSSLLLLISEYF